MRANSIYTIMSLPTKGLAECKLLFARGMRRWRTAAAKARAQRAAVSLPFRPACEPQRFLSVVAIAKNEGRYLREWIEFQRLMGVEHVFLYDNGSTDDSAKVIAPFVAEGFVTAIPWVAFDDVISPQRQAYAHALCNFGPQFRWMAFLDLDEFLFPVTDANLIEVLSRYAHCECLCVPWFMFGFSGHETPPAGLVIESFTKRAPYPPRPGRRLHLLKWKSIVQPAAVVSVGGAHNFGLAGGMKDGLDERLMPISVREPPPGLVLRVNHYYTRSCSEFRAKLDLAKFTTGTNTHRAHTGPRKRQLVAENIEAETVPDETILRFVPALRERLCLNGITSVAAEQREP